MKEQADYSIFTGRKRMFSVVDYSVFGASLAISMGIGFFYAVKDRRNKTTAAYLMGNRRLSMFPVAMSLLVTHLSAVTIMGVPAEIYNYNTMFWWICGGYIIALLGSTFVFIPFFYRLNITSVNEYLEMRFSKAARTIASMSLIFGMVLHNAFVLYAPSLALNAVTGIDVWGSVAVISTTVTIYTTLGGMKAVIWTDTFQVVVIIAGLLAVLIQGNLVMGGFEGAWSIATEKGRIVFDDIDSHLTTRHSVWSLVFGGGLFWMTLFGLHQAQVQRAVSCRSITAAKSAMLLCLVGLIFIISICCMIGVTMFAFYSECHPVKFMNLVSKSDQILPLFVMDTLGKIQGLPGLFVSCLFSGSLSSLSSSMNSASALVLQDYVRPFCCKSLSETTATVVSKVIVCIFGVLVVCCAYMVSHLGALLEAAYRLASVSSGPMFGLFFVGMFFPWTNNKGAIAGYFISLVFSCWVTFGAMANKVWTPYNTISTEGCNWNLTNITTSYPPVVVNTSLSSTIIDSSSDPFVDLYRISYLWYTGASILVQIITSLIVSFATGSTDPSTLDSKLVCNLYDILFPWLPEKIRKPLRFGVKYKAVSTTEPSVTDKTSVEEVNL